MNKFFKSILDLNKVGIQERAGEMIKNVADGIDDPLEMYIAIKKLEAVISIAKKYIGQKAFKDTNISPGEEDFFKGCKVEKVNSGTTYKWDDVIDPKYWEAKQSLKDREDFLKGLKSISMMQEEERLKYIKDNDLEIVDEETGEVLIITPVVKEQGQSLKITIK